MLMCYCQCLVCCVCLLARVSDDTDWRKCNKTINITKTLQLCVVDAKDVSVSTMMTKMAADVWSFKVNATNAVGTNSSRAVDWTLGDIGQCDSRTVAVHCLYC